MVHFSLYWVKTQRRLHVTLDTVLYFTLLGTETLMSNEQVLLQMKECKSSELLCLNYVICAPLTFS